MSMDVDVRTDRDAWMLETQQLITTTRSTIAAIRHRLHSQRPTPLGVNLAQDGDGIWDLALLSRAVAYYRSMLSVDTRRCFAADSSRLSPRDRPRSRLEWSVHIHAVTKETR